MDITTLVGLIFGILVVVLAIMSGSDLGIFLNLPGFLIVFGGTFAATLIRFPLHNVFIALKLGLKAAFLKAADDPRGVIDKALECVKVHRDKGVMALGKVEVGDNFFMKGLQLCADGYDYDIIRKTLSEDMEVTLQHHELGEKIFRAIADAAPAFGMIGTLVGLVQMLSNMSSPDALGPAMAIAMLTTLYGALIANLIALPIADKLTAKEEEERILKTLILEAVLLILEKQNPNVMEEMLQVYLPENMRPQPGQVEEDDEEEEEAGA